MNRSDLQRRIEPLAKKLAIDLAAIITAHVGARVDGVRAAALGFVHQELDEMFARADEIAAAPAEVVHRDLKPAKPRRARAARVVQVEAEPPKSERSIPIVNATPDPVNVEPAPADDDELEDIEPPPHHQPSRSLRCDRGVRRAPPIRSRTCRRPGGRPSSTGSRSCTPCPN